MCTCACKRELGLADARWVAIVKHRTHQRGHLGYLYITRMTLDTVTVAIHPPPNHDEQDVQLKIDPPLTNGREARERLYEWQAKAYEHFDVVRIILSIYRFTGRDGH